MIISYARGLMALVIQIYLKNWVGQFLIKELKPGQVVVMDTAAFHKSQKTRELIESVGCKLIFLPPYSPDLNPIEKFWAHMKRWIKQEMVNFPTLFESIASFFNTLSQLNLLYSVKLLMLKWNKAPYILN